MKILLNNTSLFKSLRLFNDLGFVPTMGGIHKGHLSLINKSNKLCKKTIVSIFVNPKQFNNKKDLRSYPRNIKKDLNQTEINNLIMICSKAIKHLVNKKIIKTFFIKKFQQ